MWLLSWVLKVSSTLESLGIWGGLIPGPTSCSVSQLCLNLYNPMDCSTWGFPVLHHLPKLAQTHFHWVIDAIQPSCPLSSLLLLPWIFPTIRVFSNESALYIRWPKCCNFSLSPSNYCSGLISFRIDWFDLLAVKGTLKTPQFKSINS